MPGLFQRLHEQRLADAPGVQEVIAYGVPVPGQDGKAGMVALILDGRFKAADFAAWVDGVVADLVRAGAAVHTETEIFNA